MAQEKGNGWVEGVHPDDRKACYEAYCSAFDAREPFQLEYRLRRADGQYRWIADRGVPHFIKGAFAGYLGSGFDITDFKQAHERILVSQRLESLRIMSSGIAHDFGNLIGGIWLEADLALSELPAESPARESIERMLTLVEYSKEIIGLLSASVGAAPDDASRERFDLSTVVERTVQLLQRSVLKLPTVRCNLRKDLPAIWGNLTQIRQVVVNLVTNASESLVTADGAIVITTGKASVSRSQHTSGPRAGLAAGDYVHLTVTDTGCGMGPEISERIFDQFFTTKAPGRGLGLAAVHGIVQSHGGFIEVTSTPGAGSTFTVWLPCAAPGADQPDTRMEQVVGVL
jgi:signal transduction histidine kinase